MESIPHVYTFGGIGAEHTMFTVVTWEHLNTRELQEGDTLQCLTGGLYSRRPNGWRLFVPEICTCYKYIGVWTGKR